MSRPAPPVGDLWKYDPGTGLWTWMSGSSTINGIAVFGTQGVPASTNVPDARQLAVAWADQDDNLWLFGGVSRRVPAVGGYFERPMAVQHRHRELDLGVRFLGRQRTRYLQHPGSCGERGGSRNARGGRELGRRVGQSVAVRRSGIRFGGRVRPSERPVEVRSLTLRGSRALAACDGNHSAWIARFKAGEEWNVIKLHR